MILPLNGFQYAGPVRIIFAVLISIFASAAKSQPLPEFKAHFDIWVMGFNIGEAEHKLSCQQQDCELTSIAEPPGWVKRLLMNPLLKRSKFSNHQPNSSG